MITKKLIDVEDILKFTSHLNKDEIDDVVKACNTSKLAHGSQKRKSNDPYYTHTFEVGKLLAELGMSKTVIVAGILHDTIEDTDLTYEDIEKDFGKEVAFFVDAVSKLGNVRYTGYSTDVQVRSLQKLFVATSKDLRVIIIKLSDRLHNMRTLEYLPKKSQKRIATETKEIFTPLAGRLGMWSIKSELEDLSFKYLEANEYKTIKRKIDKILNLKALDLFKRQALNIITNLGFTNIEFQHRIKTNYSTYQKMKLKHKPLEEIYDLLAARIITNSIDDAYSIFSLINNNFTTIPNGIKDYIALPKPNGYQSLHTRIDFMGSIIEVQIRTAKMDAQANFGIAAHFDYKDDTTGRKFFKMSFFNNLLPSNNKQKEWFEQLAEIHSGEVSDELFMDDLRSDFLKERMFVYTPKKDVIDLPIGSSVIDFAYAIHTDIGNHASGAHINGKYSSLSKELNGYDEVEIETSKKITTNKKWLVNVKTAFARHQINKILKSTEKNF